MLTDKEALQIAKEELERALYLSECSRSAGIRAINEDKSEWLSVLIRIAEQYIRKEDEGEMKIIEAINAIKCNKPTSGYTILCEALDMAVDALEKQMPKRPLKKRIVNDGYAWEWVCPNCHIVKVTTEQQFCDDCGQRLDWGDHPTEKGGEM